MDEFGLYEQQFYSWIDEAWRPQQSDIREDILDYFANRDRYVDLRSAIKRQQVVPFVGSGMSVPSGLPVWSDFLIGLGAFTLDDTSKLRQLVSSSSFEEAADLIASSMNPNLLAERVEHDLRILDSSAIDGPIGLLPRLFDSLVITTNLDNLLEQLYGLSEMPFGHILKGANIIAYRKVKSPTERVLIKLHGDCQDRDDRVLLSHEYERTYATGSTVHEELALIFQQYSLLFLGCSLGQDRTVKVIEQVANMCPNVAKHYTFLVKPSDNRERIVRENFLTERGIYPIWYDLPHDEALMALLEGLSDWENT